MLSQIRYKINTMVTNNSVKLTCGDKAFMAKGVVFDKDGVLTGGISLWEDIFWLYMKVARSKGLHIEEKAKELFGIDKELYDSPLALCTMEESQCLLSASIYLSGVQDWSHCRVLAHEIIREVDMSLPEEWLYKPSCGAQALLNILQQHIPVAVATSDSREHVKKMFSYWGMKMPLVVTAEDVERGKPYPEMLLLACSLMGVPCEFTVVFGDTQADIEMAHSANAYAVAVGRSIPQADACVRTLCDVVVEV